MADDRHRKLKIKSSNILSSIFQCFLFESLSQCFSTDGHIAKAGYLLANFSLVAVNTVEDGELSFTGLKAFLIQTEIVS